MAKKRTQALFDVRSKYESRNSGQGIGYFIPTTISPTEWKKLCKKWTRTLQKDGHDDIEQFSSNCSGHFSSFFFKTKQNNSLSGSAATIARLYKPANAEYYRRVGIFRHHAPLNKLFKGRVLLVKHILKLLADGATYQRIADYFGSRKCPRTIRRRCTYFFAYHHIERPTNRLRINLVMDQWFKDNPHMLE